MLEIDSPYLELLKNRIDLTKIPFSERGSRLLLMQQDSGLFIRMTERWFKADPRLSAYRERPPIIDQLRFLDGNGNPLEIACESYPHRLGFTTRIGLFSLIFADQETFLLRLPTAACGLTFEANLNQGQIDRRGGVLRVLGDIRRNVAYTTNRPILENSMTPQGEGHLVVRLLLAAGEAPSGLLLNLTPRLGFNRYIPGLEQAFRAAAQRWHDWFAAVPAVEEPIRLQYYYAWWIMRAGLISTRFYTTRESMTPSKIHYVGIWQWDSYFHALAYRHIDPHLAQDQIRVVLDHQRADGMIPDAVHDEGTITHLDFPVDADVTKPPLLAWAAWKVYESNHDREFLDEIYEPMVRWNQWWFEKNDLDGDGLCEYQHPYSSGLDDSPLWDEGMPVTAPDLNTYLYMQLESLGRIARTLGQVEEAEEWQRKADALLEKMRKTLWDRKSGLFWAKRNGKVIRVRTPFSLFPLLTGKLPKEISQRLVDHLTDPASFWTTYPVPTVACDDPHYNPTKMWRGPTWVNVNYLLIEGLERSGYVEVAENLRQRTLTMLMRHADVFEYYQPETGDPPVDAASVFGWSAALLIELALRAYRQDLQE